jgi:hypothetical protein
MYDKSIDQRADSPRGNQRTCCGLPRLSQGEAEAYVAFGSYITDCRTLTIE